MCNFFFRSFAPKVFIYKTFEYPFWSIFYSSPHLEMIVCEKLCSVGTSRASHQNHSFRWYPACVVGAGLQQSVGGGPVAIGEGEAVGHRVRVVASTHLQPWLRVCRSAVWKPRQNAPERIYFILSCKTTAGSSDFSQMSIIFIYATCHHDTCRYFLIFLSWNVKKDTFKYCQKTETLLFEVYITFVAMVYNILQIDHTGAGKPSKGVCPFNLWPNLFSGVKLGISRLCYWSIHDSCDTIVISSWNERKLGGEHKHSFKHSPVVIISLLMETTAIHLCNGTRPAKVQAGAPSVSSSVEEVWPPTTKYTWEQNSFF